MAVLTAFTYIIVSRIFTLGMEVVILGNRSNEDKAQSVQLAVLGSHWCNMYFVTEC